MTAPQPIPGLSAIADRYDVLLCDVWGVIHDGRERFPDACKALARYRAEYGPVVLITNAPRRVDGVVEMLDRMGVPRESWSAIVTSGEATRALLAPRAPGPGWMIGPDRDLPLYEDLGLEWTELADARFISCTGPFDDDVEGPDDYEDRFRLARANDLEMVCANPDIVVMRGDRLIYCGGALAERYADMGGRVIMAGKPHAPIYDLAVAEASEQLGRPVDRRRILCIGDGLATDIRGANLQRLDALFIAAGIHGGDAVGPNGLDADAVQALLAKEGLGAAWAMADLAW